MFGFRIWKNFVKHFSDSVILKNSDVNLLQSLVHNQLSSSRYINIFKQGWFKSNYIDKKPEKFDNLVEFGFGGSQPHCEIPIEILYIEGTKYRRFCKWARPW